MDKVDLAVLQELAKDARIKTNDLAKKIRKDRHVVSYRKNKLTEEGLILKPEIIINYQALGYNEYIVYLKLYHYLEFKDEFVKFVKNIPQIRWCGEIFPYYNIRLAIVTKTIHEFEDILVHIESFCGSKLMETEYVITRSYLRTANLATYKIPPMYSDKSSNIDNIDKKMLVALSENPTQNLLDLSRNCSLSVEGSRKRLQKLKQNVIHGIHAKLDMSKVGFHFWIILLLKGYSKKYKNEIQALVNSDSRFGKVRTGFGKWDVECTVFIENFNDFREILKLFEKVFDRNIDIYNLQVYTHRFFSRNVTSVIM